VLPKDPEAVYMDPELAIEAVKLFEPHKRNESVPGFVGLNGGCAFAHPELVEIVSGIKKIDKKIKLVINTCGLPLLKKKADRVLYNLAPLLTNEDSILLPQDDGFHKFPYKMQNQAAVRLTNLGIQSTEGNQGTRLMWAIGRGTSLPKDKICDWELQKCLTHSVLASSDKKDALSMDVSLNISPDGYFRYCCYASGSNVIHFNEIQGMKKEQAIEKIADGFMHPKYQHLPDDLNAFFQQHENIGYSSLPANCARCVAVLNAI